MNQVECGRYEIHVIAPPRKRLLCVLHPSCVTLRPRLALSLKIFKILWCSNKRVILSTKSVSLKFYDPETIWGPGRLFKYMYFCFILLFTSSSPCRKDQFAVSYFSTSLIVLIQVYHREIWHHSLVCCCGFADILNSPGRFSKVQVIFLAGKTK